jgi:pimeloyl-ACP methyl ester carboxylesterase
MKTKALRILIVTILVAIVVYVGIAFAFIFTSQPASPKTSRPMDFSALKAIDYSDLPELQFFQTRDNIRLAYRFYPADSRNALVLIHGSAYHGRYLHDLARFLSSRNLARVYTPNLRGHYGSGGKRGTIRYIGQLEDDLADLIRMIKNHEPTSKIILGGHSSGGGLAIRFGGGKHGKLADSYLLLAPFLQHDAPTTRPDAGGWAMSYVGRIIGLTMLNNVGIRYFNNMIVIKFNMPQDARDGTETLSYSYSLMTSFSPRRDYKKDLWAITQPLLLLVGNNDETFFAEQYPEVLKGHPRGQVAILPGVGHLDIVVNVRANSAVAEWLKKQ